MRGKQILGAAIGAVVVVLVVVLGVWAVRHVDDTTSSDQGTAPTSTQTVTPSTSTPLPPVSTTVQPKTTTAPLSLFYVAVGDDGVSGTRIGCDDSLVMRTTEPVTFTDQVEASFDRLLGDHAQQLGESGLRNALYQSDLSYVDSTVSGDTVTVDLTGKLTSSGTCDDPRIIAQLERTASVAAGVGHAIVKVDGKTVEQLLSAR